MGARAAVGGRPGYWFPLVLLGFGLLGLLGWHSVRPDQGFGWFAYAPARTYDTGTVEETVLVRQGAPA